MARHEGISDEANGQMRIRRELNPWLKKHLLETRFRSSGKPGASAQLGERTGRLTRRVIDRKRLASKPPSGIPLSRPFIAKSGAKTAASSKWGALVLLLSQPWKNLGNEESPKIRRWAEDNRNNISNSVMRVNRPAETHIPVRREAVPDAAKPGTQPARGKIIQRKIEEMGGQNKQLPDNARQPGEERIDNKNSNSDNIMISVDSNQEVRRAPVIAGEEGQRSLNSGSEADSQNILTPPLDEKRVASSHINTAKTINHEADNGVKTSQNIETGISLKKENLEKQVLARKILSSGSKPAPEGIVHQNQPRFTVKTNGLALSDSRKKNAPPEIERKGISVAELSGAEIVPGIIKEKATSHREPFPENLYENSEKPQSVTISKSNELNIAGDKNPAMPRTPENAHEPSGLSGSITRTDSSEETYTTPDDMPLEPRQMSKASEIGNNREDIRTDFIRNSKPSISRQINRLESLGRVGNVPDNTKVSNNTNERSSISSEVIIPVSPGKEDSGLNLTHEPLAGNAADISPSPILNIPARLPLIADSISNSKNFRLQKKSGRISHRNTLQKRQQGVEFNPDRKGGLGVEPLSEHPTPEIGSTKIPQFNPGDSLPMYTHGTNSGADGDKEPVLAEREPEKRPLQRRSAFRMMPGIQSAPLVNQVYRSIDMPVQRQITTVSSLIRDHQTDSIPLIPGINVPVALDLPVAVPGRKNAENSDMHDNKLFRQSSGNSGLAERGYHAVTQQAVTYVNRASETVPSSQSTTAAEQSENRAQDLKALARDIYPYIKRIVMIERERLPNL